MICDKCGDKHAHIHVTKLVNGKVEEMNLCEACAKKMQLIPALGRRMDIKDLMGGIVDGVQQESLPGTGSCPVCGFHYGQLSKEGRLGCPACYEAFRQPLTALNKRVQLGVTHVGKAPRTAKPEQSLERRLAGMKEEMDRAVKAENFERAAQLRDEIRALEAARVPAEEVRADER